MKKIALIIGSRSRAVLFLRQVLPFAKAEPPAEKTSTAERKILFWYDPMYPNTRFDKQVNRRLWIWIGAEICR